MGGYAAHSLGSSIIGKLTSYWFVVGLAGQAMFGMRFVVQWIASERSKRSVIPVSFWYLSLCGSVVLLAYSIHIQDPVFIIANSTNGLIYIRNLMLLRKSGAIEQCRAGD